MDAIKLAPNQGGHDVVATLSDAQRNVAMPIPSIFDVDVCVILGVGEYTGGFVCVSIDFSMALEWLVQPCLPTFQSDTRELWRKGHDQRRCFTCFGDSHSGACVAPSWILLLDAALSVHSTRSGKSFA